MKYDDLDVKVLEGEEVAPVVKKIRKKRKHNVLDIVILQLVLCVAISAVVLTARGITVVATGGTVGFGGGGTDIPAAAQMIAGAVSRFLG